MSEGFFCPVPVCLRIPSVIMPSPYIRPVKRYTLLYFRETLHYILVIHWSQVAVMLLGTPATYEIFYVIC